MSYTTILYAMDLEKLRGAIDSRSADLLRKLSTASESTSLAWRLAETGPTLGEALQIFVMGGAEPRHFKSIIGYAIKHMCDCLGTRLPDQDCIGSIESLDLASPLAHPRLPIDVAANTDFPIISYLDAVETERESQRLALLDLDFPSDADIAMAREAYSDCITAAASDGKAVISFYY